MTKLPVVAGSTEEAEKRLRSACFFQFAIEATFSVSLCSPDSQTTNPSKFYLLRSAGCASLGCQSHIEHVQNVQRVFLKHHNVIQIYSDERDFREYYMNKLLEISRHYLDLERSRTKSIVYSAPTKSDLFQSSSGIGK